MSNAVTDRPKIEMTKAQRLWRAACAVGIIVTLTNLPTHDAWTRLASASVILFLLNELFQPREAP